MNQDDRTQIDDTQHRECEGWTRYTFPARAGQYSALFGTITVSAALIIENPDEDGHFKIVNDYTGARWLERSG